MISHKKNTELKNELFLLDLIGKSAFGNKLHLWKNNQSSIVHKKNHMNEKLILDIFINYLLGKSENDMKRMCAQKDFYLSNFANGAENSIECNFLL